MFLQGKQLLQFSQDFAPAAKSVRMESILHDSSQNSHSKNNRKGAYSQAFYSCGTMSLAPACRHLTVKSTAKDLSSPPRPFAVKLFQFQHIIRISDGQQSPLRQPVWLLILQPLIIVERTV